MVSDDQRLHRRAGEFPCSENIHRNTQKQNVGKKSRQTRCLGMKADQDEDKGDRGRHGSHFGDFRDFDFDQYLQSTSLMKVWRKITKSGVCRVPLEYCGFLPGVLFLERRARREGIMFSTVRTAPSAASFSRIPTF